MKIMKKFRLFFGDVFRLRKLHNYTGHDIEMLNDSERAVKKFRDFLDFVFRVS